MSESDMSSIYLEDPDTQLVFVNQIVKATHTHEGTAMARLYYIKHEKIRESKYCSGCLPPGMPFSKKLKYHTCCPECEVLTPLIEGPHIWCAECGVCTGSIDAHWFYHEPGKCHACTDPNGDIPHSWCPICKVCRPFAELHEHEDSDE